MMRRMFIPLSSPAIARQPTARQSLAQECLVWDHRRILACSREERGDDRPNSVGLREQIPPSWGVRNTVVSFEPRPRSGARPFRVRSRVLCRFAAVPLGTTAA